MTGARPAPTVSVIVPAFCTERYIGEAIDSLRMQTLTDIEIICIDDGSTDGTRAVIDQRATEDERVKALAFDENRGVGAARNAGIDIATGRFVYFFDSDDRLVVDALEQLVAAMSADRLDVVLFDAAPFYDPPGLEATRPGYPAYYRRRQEHVGVMTGLELFTSMALADDWKPSPCLYLLDRDFASAHGLRFEAGLLHEDQSFTFAMAMAARRARYLPARLFERRVRADSIMTAAAPRASQVAGLALACAEASRLADDAGIVPESVEGRAIAAEFAKTFDDAVRKHNALEDDERERLGDFEERSFGLRDALRAIAASTAAAGSADAEQERRRLEAELAGAVATIAEYRQAVWRRALRRLLRR